MDSINSDLLGLIRGHLSSNELVFLFKDQDIKYCKSIKEACRRVDWSWIVYYFHPPIIASRRMEGYRYQYSCLKQGYYGSCEIGNIELMNMFKNLYPALSEDRFQVKYFAKNGNIEWLNSYFKGKELGIGYFYLLCGIIKTHNTICFDLYKSNIKNYLLDYNLPLVQELLVLAIRYDNKEVLMFIKELVENNQEYSDLMIGKEVITWCNMFLFGIQPNKMHNYVWSYPGVVIEKTGRIDLFNFFKSSHSFFYDESIILGAIKGNHTDILNCYDLEDPDIIGYVCCGYIIIHNHDKFIYYYDQLDRDDKNMYRTTFIKNAIMKNNYRAIEIILNDLEDGHKVDVPADIIACTENINIAILLSKNLQRFQYSIEDVVGALSAAGRNVVADILLESHLKLSK